MSGENLERRERKVPHNGADGVPICEEIVARHAAVANAAGEGEIIITRNAYGARCLNTPNVFFADVDFESSSCCGFTIVALFLLLAAAATFAIIVRPKAS